MFIKKDHQHRSLNIDIKLKLNLEFKKAISFGDNYSRFVLQRSKCEISCLDESHAFKSIVLFRFNLY